MHASRLLALGLPLLAAAARAEDSSVLRAIFADPPRQYSTGPLWVWNDMLTEEQVKSSLGDLAAQKVKQAWVHPRPGLMTPYLSADWFRLWKAALGEAERLDMNLWIYDENSYPSGFAGGWVPELMPESRGRGLIFREEARPAKPGPDVLGVYRLTGDCPDFGGHRAQHGRENGTVPLPGEQGFENVTAKSRAGEPLPEARYLVARVQRAGNDPWHGNRCYVDLMYPGVTEKFLDVTLEAYRREVGGEFGKRVPGTFCDEPNIRPAGGLPWTDGLPAAFQKRWGYSLLDHLPSLVRPVGLWKQVRHDYYRVLLEQFIEHWSKPYHDYCEKHGLEWTGHYWDHEWPNCVGVPDNMAMYAWHQRPAIDCLMNQYREDTHAQFGNVRMVRELSSIANQLGKRRTLCEVYGAGGWDLRFEDMKRIGDWLEVLGVNTLDQHLSYVTIRGARKADHPQSFSYHEPWWPAYHVLAQYFTRLSAALSHGEQVNHILVIEPTTTAWMYQGDEAKLEEIGKSFCDLLMSLEQAQVEYDIGCEDVIARHGSVLRGGVSFGGKVLRATTLRIGERGYGYGKIVLPPETETLDAKTVDLLEEFVGAGGRVSSCGPAPPLVDGRPSRRCEEIRGKDEARFKGTGSEGRWRRIEPAELPEKLLRGLPNLFGTDLNDDICRPVIARSPGDKGVLFHQTRYFRGHDGFYSDESLLFLVNASVEWPSSGTVSAEAERVEQWDSVTGTITPVSLVPAKENPGFHRSQRIHVPFHLAPGGSLLLCFSEPTVAMRLGDSSEDRPAAIQAAKATTLPPAGPPRVRRVEPNVLTLDYMDLTVGQNVSGTLRVPPPNGTRSVPDTVKRGLYFYRANQLAFAANGMERNPWDSAVQFKDELISKKFPPESGFEATYRFTIAQEVPKGLEIVIERPDLYTIACNGKPLTRRADTASPRPRVSASPRPASADRPHPRAPTAGWSLPEGEGTKTWWLDKAFGRIDLAAAAKVGENTVTIKASPMTIYHELEPAYLLGDFQVQAGESGFVVAPPKPLDLSPWDKQGHPFYAAGVSYSEEFNLPKLAGRYRVALGKWYGSVARVAVNGKEAGYIGWQPWECDVTGLLRPGGNTIEVTVIGTLKNTLGPHHAGKVAGSAWPGHFHQGPETGPPPGAAYDTIGYGLFEPFTVRNLSE